MARAYKIYLDPRTPNRARSTSSTPMTMPPS